MKRNIKVGNTLREITSDDTYLTHVGDVFEPDMTAVFRALIDPQMTVADVGGNIGMTALLFSELARHVYAFEPGRSTFGILRGNTDGIANIEPVNIGMGERCENQTLTFATSNRSGGFVSNDIKLSNASHTTEEIRIETLDSFFFNRPVRPDFIKMDVEGFEPAVLRGAHALIAQQKPTVVLELNHFCLNVMQRVSLPDFFDQLRALFPVLLAVDTGNTRLANLHESEAAYMVMHNHATRFAFPNIVAGFSDGIHRKMQDVVALATSAPKGA